MSAYRDSVIKSGLSMQSWIVISITACIVVILALMFGIPVYSVWQQEYSGKAALAKAEQTRQILVTQANAEREAATARAEAIKIMGQAAKDFPEYRQQEYMAAFGEALREGKMSQVIYIPTEANIPIMEASRFKHHE
jgi:hypothetical protein